MQSRQHPCCAVSHVPTGLLHAEWAIWQQRRLHHGPWGLSNLWRGLREHRCMTQGRDHHRVRDVGLQLLGVWTVAEWQRAGKPPRLRLVEAGPGAGTLASDMLRVQPSPLLSHASARLHSVQHRPPSPSALAPFQPLDFAEPEAVSFGRGCPSRGLSRGGCGAQASAPGWGLVSVLLHSHTP